jgi:hypothetical protein
MNRHSRADLFPNPNALLIDNPKSALHSLIPKRLDDPIYGL